MLRLKANVQKVLRFASMFLVFKWGYCGQFSGFAAEQRAGDVTVV